MIDDPRRPTRTTVSRVVFCSGKIYYDLLAAREERKADHVALVRVEQLYPFESDQAREILARYSDTAEVVWAQEEPRNMGAWRIHARADSAAARCDAARSALCRQAREREPGNGVGQAAPAGVGGDPE